MRRLKICDLTQFYSPVSGGVKRYLHEKGRHIAERTGDAHLVIIPGERDGRETRGPVTLYTVRSPLLSRTTQYRALLRLGAVEEILKAEAPDLIESADPYQVGWKAIACGESLGIPVVGFYHSHFPEAYLRSRFLGPISTELLLDAARRYVRRLYNRFARTLVPSPPLGQILAEWGVENTLDVDLGVDAALFCPTPDDAAATRRALGIPEGRQVLLYVGRLAHEKNTETLFKAFALLHRAEPGRRHLVIVGDGLQRPGVETLRAETGEVTWIAYCGEAARLAAIYRAADLFVHPGVQETFGLVSLEAQACGTPVVGIRGSFMDRIIFSGQGRWAAENTPKALAGAIAGHAECDLRAAGAAASRKVRDHYSWEAVFGRLFTVYRETIADYKRADA